MGVPVWKVKVDSRVRGDIVCAVRVWIDGEWKGSGCAVMWVMKDMKSDFVRGMDVTRYVT